MFDYETKVNYGDPQHYDFQKKFWEANEYQDNL